MAARTIRMEAIPAWNLQVPQDLAAALDENPAVRRAFDGLGYAQRRRHVLSVGRALTPGTRLRRIADVVEFIRREQLRQLPRPSPLSRGISGLAS